MEAATGACFFLASRSAFPPPTAGKEARTLCVAGRRRGGRVRWLPRGQVMVTAALEKGAGSGGKKAGGAVPNSNYVVPLDKASCLTRPLAEILRDLNKRVPDKIINTADNSIPWYHTNRMLSFYAPGWCGEVRDVTFSNNGSVTVIYRVTIQGSDGEAHRDATGTVSLNDDRFEDPVAAAEEVAFCKACARFGFGLYLYHEGEAFRSNLVPLDA